MDSKNRYYRNFLIFELEDMGFDNGQIPSGYIKIESKDGKGKLLATVQNLKEDTEKLKYKVYILKSDGLQVWIVCAGALVFQKGRAEVRWDFDTDNVAETGIPINQFNVAAIIVSYSDSENSKIICPLAAYKDQKISWRENAGRKLYLIAPKNGEFEEELLTKHDSYEPIYKSEEPDGQKTNAPLDEKTEPIADQKPFYEFNYEQEMPELNKDQINNGGDCILKNNIFCSPQMTYEGYNACMNCYARNSKREEVTNKNITEYLEKLRKNLEKYFVVFDPFGSRRRDYTWWKVDSPINLNNILYQCNIRTPLLFNPSVMMAHFKFRHLAIGIYSDRIRHREFIVCGVPGVHRIDTNPFGDMCKWIQLEGKTPKYGAFGYWLVYINPTTGKFLKIP